METLLGVHPHFFKGSKGFFYSNFENICVYFLRIFAK